MKKLYRRAMLTYHRVSLDMLVSEAQTTLNGVEAIQERLKQQHDSALSELRMSM
jgi:hypothetical protein